MWRWWLAHSHLTHPWRRMDSFSNSCFKAPQTLQSRSCGIHWGYMVDFGQGSQGWHASISCTKIELEQPPLRVEQRYPIITRTWVPEKLRGMESSIGIILPPRVNSFVPYSSRDKRSSALFGICHNRSGTTANRSRWIGIVLSPFAIHRCDDYGWFVVSAFCCSKRWPLNELKQLVGQRSVACNQSASCRRTPF